MSERGPETLPDVRGDQGALMNVQEWSEVTPECQEWSGVSPGCPRVVGRRSQMSVSGRKALPEAWEWWGGPLGCPGGLANIWEWSEAPP